jgi:hypothetical protein
MVRIILACTLAAAGSLALFGSAHAAGSAHHSQRSADTWSQHDTAVYVVSTLNLLRTHAGKSVATILQHRDSVARYDVLGDSRTTSLYFVELKEADGSTFGVYAYQLGWARPMAVTSSVSHFGVKLATSDIVAAYRSDPKALLESFTSTLPQ